MQHLREKFEAAGQGQIFACFDQLEPQAREKLLADASEIDPQEVNRLVELHLHRSGEGENILEGLEPAPYEALPENGGEPSRWAQARATGEEALRAGRVAAFTVAGGQGTRLGYDGPKGTYPATPVRQKPLFAVFAEKILAASRRYEVDIPWFIMTSHANHAQTLAFFEENDWCGLPKEKVFCFMQGRMPAVDPQGKIILSGPAEIAMSPDGHGGSLRALNRSGACARMEAAGIDIISYFQVDNPLVHFIDPTFIGFHLLGASEMSSKMVPKAYPLEKVGHFCRRDGRTVVVEYSDMPASMQEERLPDGSLRFRAGSVAIHLFARQFVERMGGASSALPFHKAHKKIPYLDANGEVVKPEEPNGYKFEMFVFDALPLAENPVIIEGRREDEFSPIKNAEGVDSPETCRQDQIRQWTRWARQAGLAINTDESGLPDFCWEVSPLFADSAGAFQESCARLDNKPVIAEGTVLA